MLRYPATTITLAMAEVKEFERHRRYRRHLAIEAVRARSLRDVESVTQAQPVLHTSAEGISKDNGRREHEDAGVAACSRRTVLSSADATLMLELPPSPQKTLKVDSSDEPSPQGRSYISQSTVSNSDSLRRRPTPNTAALTIMPPTLLMGEIPGSDQHSLTMRTTSRTSAGLQSSREGPVTPSRSSSLAGLNPPVMSPEPIARRHPILRSTPRFADSYARSPGRRSSSPSSSLSLEERREGEPSLQESDSQLRVYNDSLLASAQPSTPQHLPEARHQSRLQGSYTAPVLRSRPRGAYDSGIVPNGHGRAHSPPGLNTPGFRGLYGGMENADDLTLHRQAARSFDNGQDSDINHTGS